VPAPERAQLREDLFAVERLAAPLTFFQDSVEFTRREIALRLLALQRN
jgi:hypothetical protein